jgi:glycerol-3-phosphate dehydrogenase
MKSETKITQVEDFDVLVLGSGEAGKYIAWEAPNAGTSAAVIERRYIGGSCPNIAFSDLLRLGLMPVRLSP